MPAGFTGQSPVRPRPERRVSDALCIHAMPFILTISLLGCTTGSKALSRMSAEEIHGTVREGVSTKREIRAELGDPQYRQIEDGKVHWHYRYYKTIPFVLFPVALVAFPLIPPDEGASLSIAFRDDDVVDTVEYRGDR